MFYVFRCTPKSTEPTDPTPSATSKQISEQRFLSRLRHLLPSSNYNLTTTSTDHNLTTTTTDHHKILKNNSAIIFQGQAAFNQLSWQAKNIKIQSNGL